MNNRRNYQMKVFRFQKCCHGLFDNVKSHSAATIIDLSNNEAFDIDFWPTKGKRKRALKDRQPEAGVEVVTLYFQATPQELEAFKKEFKQNFLPEFHSNIWENCADAVNFALDRFFPENSCAESCWELIKHLMCCSCFLLSCGGSCFPAPPCVSTPSDVMTRAKSLAEHYGKPSSDEKKSIVSENKVKTTTVLTEKTPLKTPLLSIAPPPLTLSLNRNL